MVRTLLSTSLFTWKLDATDVSRMAGHANYRITLDMYVGSTAGAEPLTAAGEPEGATVTDLWGWSRARRRGSG